MIRKTSIYTTENLVPYRNFATEIFLTHHTEPGECILFLWQNRKTVVVGRNQNCWEECRVRRLEEAGGYLARRLSGGGAVFHDLGNLNFTFCVRAGEYDVNRQSEVILRAVRKLGIEAEKSGRNDLTAGGRKFSGSAFYRSGDFCYHHGTILVDADQDQMAEYLNVPEAKLRSKGVKSVRSRTVNLKSLRQELTVAGLKQALAESFGEVYGCEPRRFSESRIDREQVAEAERKFASREWKYGRRIAFQQEFRRRFAWGGLDIRLQIEAGIICQPDVYTDAMDASLARQITERLTGCRYDARCMAERLESLPADEGVREEIRSWLFLETEKG